MNAGAGIDERERTTRLRPRAWTELLLVLGLFLAYKIGRLVVDGRVSDAFADAHLIWDIERALRLPDEAAVQRVLLSAEALVRAANVFYAVVHFPATIAFLVFMYCFRPDHYLRFRRILAWLTAIGLVIHFAFPLAPPRMLGGLGLIDTAAVYGPSVYGPPQADTLSNQYAAMPSLHVGWALVVAAGFIHATRSRWRWLWLAHPIVTMLVVAGTANHYWLDGVVAAILVGVLLMATSRQEHPSPAVPMQVRRASTGTDGPRKAVVNAGAAAVSPAEAGVETAKP
ncbi:phosphatase PAP2 family protein [Dactylosporangium sp. NPDC000555]|uniref:phosphatase PAP2 family protein n=1 Tax=Dactylosporangium sp. NPDC000555 TaxID=3154260 RepID=UPI00331E3735